MSDLQQWECTACTLLNGLDTTECSACGTAHPDFIVAAEPDKTAADDDEALAKAIAASEDLDQQEKSQEKGQIDQGIATSLDPWKQAEADWAAVDAKQSK